MVSNEVKNRGFPTAQSHKPKDGNDEEATPARPKARDVPIALLA
jgi:hypothetical protein